MKPPPASNGPYPLHRDISYAPLHWRNFEVTWHIFYRDFLTSLCGLLELYTPGPLAPSPGEGQGLSRDEIRVCQKCVLMLPIYGLHRDPADANPRRWLMLKPCPRGHVAMVPENPREDFCLVCGERRYRLDDGTWTGKQPPLHLNGGTIMATIHSEAGPLPTPSSRGLTIPLFVDLAAIHPNPWQPRQVVDPQSVADLAENIALVGLLQIPLGRQNLQEHTVELAFGHRRVAALRLLAEQGRWTGGVPMQVQDLDDRTMAILALVENQQRRQLSPLEEYKAYRKALDTAAGLTLAYLARRLGLDRSTLSNNLRILQLPAVVLDRVESGELSGHAAREFLCLQAQDHAHGDIMEHVIRAIAGSPAGHSPDWRVENVRRLIQGRVQESQVSQWRRLGGAGGYYGASHSAGPNFDTEAFKKEFTERVHQMPSDKGSLAWTCATAEWKKWQDAATAATKATKATKEGADPREGSPKSAGLGDLLARDPVARRVLGDGCPETSVERALSAMGPVRLAEPADCNSPECPVHHDGDALYCPDGNLNDSKAQGQGKLVAHLRRFVDSHPHPDSWANLLSSIDDLHRTMGLSEFGVTVEEAAEAARSFLEDLKQRLALQEEMGAQILTAEQMEALGTRGQVLEANRARGFQKPLDPRGYDGPPFFFDDLPECLERCTWGATYVKPRHEGEAQLHCTNEECWSKKLAKGKEAALERLADHKELEAKEEEERVGAVVAEGIPDAFLRRVAEALLLAHGKFSRRYPAWAPEYRYREFNYYPYTLLRTQQVLGLPESDGLGGVLAVAALQKAPDPVAAQVAALLLVYTLGPQPKAERG